jgi:adenine-specific DNA-methyltransferase
VITTSQGWLEQVDFFRVDATRRLDPERKAALGQFLTPVSIARLIASFLHCDAPDVVLLDAGAGVGALLGAVVEMLCERSQPPRSVEVVAYEIEPLFLPYLRDTLCTCAAICHQAQVAFSFQVIEEDFIAHAVDLLTLPLLSKGHPTYTCAVLNPPYHKIRTDSQHRQLLRRVGIETSNIYPGFLALAAFLLSPGGELAAITPRSFCNGPYFRPFRQFFLKEMALQQFHIFESRERAFRDDAVLQENIIFSAQKTKEKPAGLAIRTGLDSDDDSHTVWNVSYTDVIQPDDPHQVIRLAADALEQQVATQMARLHATLDSLGLSVSTGRVVDFRAASFLRQQPGKDTAPLIYPTHITGGVIQWPKPQSKKPNALVSCAETRDLFVPNEHYVLVRRFTAKEERKRVVAVVYDARHIPGAVVGFENHLNYFHRNGQGLPPVLAKGLAVFLNSTLVDTYLRQFNGHTQVNAADLRMLRYPSIEQLLALGRGFDRTVQSQQAIDGLVAQELGMTDETFEYDPIAVKQKVGEAQEALRQMGMPREQYNERSALTLLALLDLTPDKSWSKASAPLCGITPMMDFFARYYGRQYQPNTRETVRRRTVHQFLEAGLIVANPDQPDRPTTSPNVVYQIEQSALALLRSYGTDQWQQNLKVHLASTETLKQRYQQERNMQRIPVTLPSSGEVVSLSPGGQNILVEKIIHEFAPRFTPGGQVLYIGDTDEKFAFFDEDRLRSVGVVVDAHGKMPDVIIHHTDKAWLVLIEAVTSHGPIDPKRRWELSALFENVQVGLVYVTAFLSRQALKEYLTNISWETEVWVAESPSHLIHFDGERFLGPYQVPGEREEG